jgi:hypothetical protein
MVTWPPIATVPSTRPGAESPASRARLRIINIAVGYPAEVPTPINTRATVSVARSLATVPSSPPANTNPHRRLSDCARHVERGYEHRCPPRGDPEVMCDRRERGRDDRAVYRVQRRAHHQRRYELPGEGRVCRGRVVLADVRAHPVPSFSVRGLRAVGRLPLAGESLGYGPQPDGVVRIQGVRSPSGHSPGAFGDRGRWSIPHRADNLAATMPAVVTGRAERGLGDRPARR